MQDDVVIERAREIDLPSLRPLIQELSESMDSPPNADAELAIENARILLNDPNHHLLVAKIADQVVGFVNFTTRKTIMHARPSGLIDELVTSKDFRGRGIGKRLIEAAIEACQQLDCEEVEVSTEKNNTEARKFYKRCGFEEDAVLLERALDY